MSLKKVLIIQHSDNVKPGYVSTFLTENNIPFNIIQIYKSDVILPPNDTQDYFAIISLGGPQGAYEDNIYEYLKWEKQFLHTQLTMNTTHLLGICLGAQLLADTCGGKAFEGEQGCEAGYVQYELTDEGKSDPILSQLLTSEQQSPLLIMHHGDTFRLPSSAIKLAYTSNGYIAAYRINKAFCVQFHPEANFEVFNEWIQRGLQKLPRFYSHLNLDEILKYASDNEHKAELTRKLFFKTWWETITNNSSTV
ncbi:unnamed protein product [Didymodactylos carnosus]|uniref:Glutamine amidotransferase domain-containing protein n=1 Tax=Didymodactylos carnosus TaxID=1234261 RepID=A0A813XJZ0_9BILA|nr:unnamed protein product [Didymodactylos carnosus]CAF0871315.1 unnamed protein product [Didymodactylos carnosus]CAF3522053.1 unnamed protein product [Didymodactylos carnosus]CAF3658620.1 unnamed protein product [Didymodactylos carnosus]